MPLNPTNQQTNIFLWLLLLLLLLLLTNLLIDKIDYSLKNSLCRLCSDEDETVNHTINKYSKIASKEYKTKSDWMGKVIQLDLFKWLKFDYCIITLDFPSFHTVSNWWFFTVASSF